MTDTPTTELVISGGSDDLVELDGAISEEFNGDDVLLLVTSGGAQVKVRVTYVDGGVWQVAYAPVDEDVQGIPGRIDVSRYSARLTLEVGPSCVVHRLPDPS